MMKARDGIIRKVCPLCGGKIVVSDLYQISYNHTVTKSGKLSKKYSVSSPGSMEVSIAACENAPDGCKASWDADSFFIDEKDRFVDLQYPDEREGKL